MSGVGRVENLSARGFELVHRAPAPDVSAETVVLVGVDVDPARRVGRAGFRGLKELRNSGRLSRIAASAKN